MQIQALLAAAAAGAAGGRGAGGGRGEAGIRSIEVAKPQLFDGIPSKVVGFVTGCKLYIRNKLVGATVKAQVQWVLSFVQGGSADI